MRSANRSVAVIGVACEFPGAHSPEELWQNVLAGRRSFRKAPPERLPPEYFDPNPETPGRSYCDVMAVLTGWRFDPVEFRIPPVTFQATDAAHWLALSTARAAIRSARLKLDSINRARTGVVLGNSLTGEFSRSHNLRFRWPYVERSIRRALASKAVPEGQLRELVDSVREAFEAPLPEITEDTLAGNMANTIAGRVCNHFDFGAGGFTVDGACSSSLLSVATACNALVAGEMDLVLAGGVDVSLDPFEIVGFAKTRALATDDIRPYDERAAGMLTGEGCGILVLAREEDARAAGHPIQALIRGWSCSSDGAGGITAPEVEGQLRALRGAYERAGYPISTVDLIEGHGTGTALGDKVEITAIHRLLNESPGASLCRIGSIKANIGHCKAAAGVAGLIKVVQALRRKVLPPTVNCDRPNPAFGLPLGRLRPNRRGAVWNRGAAPRRASVSSMGFGGANAHVTLEEANPDATASPGDLALLGNEQTSELVVLAADSLSGLRERAEKLLRVARRICRAELTDLSAALVRNPSNGKYRLGIVADSPWHLADSLKACRERLSEGTELNALDDPSSGIFAGAIQDNPRWVALFPGQGAQRLNMGECWGRRFPFVRELHDQVSRLDDESAALRTLSERVFQDPFAAGDHARQASETELRDTRIAQPAIVLTSMAAFEVLRFFGLTPAMVIGHSLGEISALAAIGVLEPVTAVRVAALRGAAMANLVLTDRGTMAAVGAGPDVVGRLIGPLRPALAISNYNSPRQTVVSGASAVIEKFSQICEREKILCRALAVSHAFHSEMIAPAATAFCDALSRVQPLVWREHAPTRRPKPANGAPTFISSLTGEPAEADTDWTGYLAEQIRQPVRFTSAVLEAVGSRPALWIEVGPGGILSGFVRDIVKPLSVSCLPMDLADQDGFRLLNHVLARAWVIGFPVRLDRLFAHRFCRPIDVEHYDPGFIVNPCERQVNVADLRERSRQSAAAEKTGRPSAILDREALFEFALDWIARRTGYPRSALSPDKRLRDDINLDSIKAGELVLLLARKLNRQFDADPASAANGRISDLVEAVWSKSVPAAVTTGVPVSHTIHAGTVPSLAGWVRTFRMEMVPAPMIEAQRRSGFDKPEDAVAAIVCDRESRRSEAVAKSVQRLGFTPLVTDVDALSNRARVRPNLATLILILPEAEPSLLISDPDQYSRHLKSTVTTFYRLFQWLARREDEWKGRCLVVRPTSAGAEGGPDPEGVGGLLKSLSLEHPVACFQSLTLPAAWPPKRWGEWVAKELATPRGRGAIACRADGREVCESAMPLAASPRSAGVVTSQAKRPAAVSNRTSSLLGSDDVVLVSGGGKGITFELALALALKTGARLLVLGSSPPPDVSADLEDGGLRRNLRRLAEHGVRHRYVQADVTDALAVKNAVRAAESELGPVTAILHGAGISTLRRFREKELEEFSRCIQTKVQGLHNLLAAVSLERLKALHVISSVLGKTGMRGQTDYTWANAWLDGRVRAFKNSHPHIHCLSVGYTAWAGTGLAERMSAVDSLRAAGVLSISVEEGIAAYLDLLDGSRPDGIYVVTGRLTADLESSLYAPLPQPPGRFLERMLRRVPAVELVADATLSHATDLYLPEHVFEGTPMFPGVMAIEAMVQAAMACAGRTEWPVLRDIEFRMPLIVPSDATVVVRTLALAEPETDGAVRVRVAVRSERDGFTQNHFEAVCCFESKSKKIPGDLCLPQPMPAPIERDPEEFSPVPLFQGKFFRRIASIRRLAMGEASLTEIQVPDGERYFGVTPQDAPVTPSPAVRDACLQSGALILPPGCLPSHISELRFRARGEPGSRVFCATWVRRRDGREFVVDVAAFDSGGTLLESVVGLRLKATGTKLVTRTPARPIGLARIESDLRALIPGIPHAITFVHHDGSSAPIGGRLIAAQRAKSLDGRATSPRRTSRNANLIAARAAVSAFMGQADARAPGSSNNGSLAESRKVGGRSLSPTRNKAPARTTQVSAPITVAHLRNGKPVLRFADGAAARACKGVEISLADGCGWSVVLLAPTPVGVDVEPVERRDAETWRGLLGDEGYALALQVSAETAESFDIAATRVWTLLEAGRKASGLKRCVPRYESARGGSWHGFAGSIDGCNIEFLSATVHLSAEASSPPGRRPVVVLSIAVECPTETIDGVQKSGGARNRRTFKAAPANLR